MNLTKITISFVFLTSFSNLWANENNKTKDRSVAQVTTCSAEAVSAAAGLAMVKTVQTQTAKKLLDQQINFQFSIFDVADDGDSNSPTFMGAKRLRVQITPKNDNRRTFYVTINNQCQVLSALEGSF